MVDAPAAAAFDLSAFDACAWDGAPAAIVPTTPHAAVGTRAGADPYHSAGAARGADPYHAGTRRGASAGRATGSER